MRKRILPTAMVAAFLLADPSASFAQTSGSFSFGAPKAAESTELVTVQAKGQGESVEAAKKDAIRNAIKIAVGELVDAKTLVENDELVKDKILTLSNAMVEKADYGESKSVSDGLFEVPVTAVVKKGRLNQELKAVGIATGAVAGDSLAATLFSGKERVANAEKFFAERLKDFPQNVMEAVMLTNDDGTPNIEINTDKGLVSANVGVRVNMDNYQKWTMSVMEILGNVCRGHDAVSLSFQEKNYSYITGGVGKGLDGDELSLQIFQEPVVPVVVATPSEKKLLRHSWPATVYYLDPQMFNALSKQLKERLGNNRGLDGKIHFSLTDSDNDPVYSSTMTVDSRPSQGAGFIKWSRGLPISACVPWESTSIPFGSFVLVSPVLKHDVRMGGNSLSYNRELDPVLEFRIDIGNVTEKDLADVTGYEVKLEFR